MKATDERQQGRRSVASAVAGWWRRWREPARRLGNLSYRLFLIVGYAWVGLRIDLPVIGEYFPLKNVLICLVAIILTGKTLYDTLFYDHFRP
jgi:hypothetical protein